MLLAAAAPLLQLMARLRNTANAPDSGDLYQRTVRQIRTFEQETRDKGVPLEQLRPAHYALCASLDDIVLNTPWGSSGTWSQRSLVSTFHQEVRSGERFFDLLKQMCDNPGRFLPVIKLMYLCMSLGFVGQYRLSRRGGGEISRIREETYAVIARQQKAAEADLAPHTKGVNAPYRPARFIVPLWVAAAAGLGDRRRAVPVVLHQPQCPIRYRLCAAAERARPTVCRRSPARRLVELRQSSPRRRRRPNRRHSTSCASF